MGVVDMLRVVFLVGCAVLHLIGCMHIVLPKVVMLYMPTVGVRCITSACKRVAPNELSLCALWGASAGRWCRCAASCSALSRSLCAAPVAQPCKLAVSSWALRAGSWLAAHTPAWLAFHVELCRSCVVG
eukprot:5794292-Pyramimonas_sp.AAC.1